MLDRIDPSAVLHIDEVDDIEAATFRQLLLLLVLQIVIVKLGGQRRKLIVVHYHSKALLTVLSEKRLDDGEGLT